MTLESHEPAPVRPVGRRSFLLTSAALAGLPLIANALEPARAAESGTQATLAYVGSRTTKERNARGVGLSVYRIDPATGAWDLVQVLGDLINPSFLTFDREQRSLYAVHGDLSEVSAFAIDKQSGQLTPLGQQSTGGKNPVHLVVDPSNRFLILANYATGTLAVLPIQPDGSLLPLVDLVSLPGQPGPHKVEQASSHPHEVFFDRVGRFIVVPDKGLDRVFAFRLDSETGKLAPAEPPPVETREVSGPRHGDFCPSGQFAYVINELNSTITTYRYDDERGALAPLQVVSTLPASFTGNSRASGIVVAPSGDFVFGTNRGHDSIVILAIDPVSRLLTPIGWESSDGKKPRFLALDPTGKKLVVANEDTDTIVEFRVENDGKLVRTGQAIQTGSPVCVVFATA